MTTTLQQAIGKFAGQARPLRNFTREQLFIYPQADPSTEAGFKFAREIIHRREVFNRIKSAVDTAKDRLEEAHQKMVRNAHEAKAPYEKQVDMRKRDLAKAQADMDGILKNDEALSHEEVQSHYRAKHLPEYEAMIVKWKSLDLFKAESFGWATFLTTDRDTRKGDETTFKALEALAGLCNEGTSKTFLEIMVFNAFRIAPSMGWRRQFLDEGDNLKAPASLEKDQQRFYWDAWRAYNTATFNYKWVDDSGVAYDERNFKIKDTED